MFCNFFANSLFVAAKKHAFESKFDPIYRYFVSSVLGTEFNISCKSDCLVCH